MNDSVTVESLDLNEKRRGVHPGNYESHEHGEDRYVIPRRDIRGKKFKCGEGQHIILTPEGVSILHYKHPERR